MNILQNIHIYIRNVLLSINELSKDPLAFTEKCNSHLFEATDAADINGLLVCVCCSHRKLGP